MSSILKETKAPQLSLFLMLLSGRNKWSLKPTQSQRNSSGFLLILHVCFEVLLSLMSQPEWLVKPFKMTAVNHSWYISYYAVRSQIIFVILIGSNCLPGGKSKGQCPAWRDCHCQFVVVWQIFKAASLPFFSVCYYGTITKHFIWT